MKVKEDNNTIEIDAAGNKLGRVASAAAKYLMGKNNPDFERHVPGKNKVTIINTSKLILPLSKRKGKTYVTYSGYPGGQKKKNMNQVIAEKGVEEVVKKSVYGMLPPNKLRAIMMKNLTITE